MSKPTDFNPEDYKATLLPLIKSVATKTNLTEKKLNQLLRSHPKDRGLFKKSELIAAFKSWRESIPESISLDEFRAMLKKRPVRSQSGVTPVTVLTKPFPCPGKCIFCPNDVRMPKSYLADEPGAQRASRNFFDPYLQTYNRLKAMADNGHSTGKIELIILGGTWSYYPEPYQIWFVTRCYQAMNDFGLGVDNREKVQVGSDFTHMSPKAINGNNITKTYNQVVSGELVKDSKEKLLYSWESASWKDLEAAQRTNESNPCRNVGLVIETRPDNISEEEVMRIRRLGCTKTQIGFQSLSDKVLSLNKRGHDVAATRNAMKLLRAAGFKIHAHWMANLYGSSVAEDIEDFSKMFSDPDFMPDELKVYPCSLIETAELMSYYQQGLWQPYTKEQLLEVVTAAIAITPEYCRLSRIIRDIPGTDIVVGNKITNFRQLAEAELDHKKVERKDIRSREIGAEVVDPNNIKLKDLSYATSTSKEHFLQYVTAKNKIIGFLRLSLPQGKSFISELSDSAIVREVHVYGVSLPVGEKGSRESQHLGLGTKLLEKAKQIAKEKGFTSLAVISAIGTRQYYRDRGFKDGKLYQHFKLE